MLWASPAAAQVASSVVVGSLGLELGESGTVEITSNDFTDPDGLAGFDFSLSFDPTIVQMDGVRGGDTPFNQAPVFNIDNGTGQVKFNSIQISMIPGPTEDLLIARIDVTAVGGGSADLVLAIQPGGFIDTTAAEISAEVSTGRVTVLIPPTAIPTPMPMPMAASAPVAAQIIPLPPEEVSSSEQGQVIVFESRFGLNGWILGLLGGVVAFASLGAGFFLARRRPSS
jgi:hypothetical protein